jgi:hypothetical protein
MGKINGFFCGCEIFCLKYKFQGLEKKRTGRDRVKWTMKNDQYKENL